MDASLSTIPADDELLTTGSIAKLCSVSPRTVSKWIDAGRLPGFRVPGQIPGCGDRRVVCRDFKRFLAEHDMPSLERLTELRDAKQPR